MTRVTILNSIERANRIQKIKKAIESALDEGKYIDEELLMYEICDKFNCAERTAKEYIRIAKKQIERKVDIL